jgi:hypothetical protein
MLLSRSLAQSIATGTDRTGTTDNQPAIISRAKSYKDAQGRNVHDRLYQQGIERAADIHNTQAQLIQSKLNLTIRPWEAQRSKEIPASWTQERTHKEKQKKSIDDYLWQRPTSPSSRSMRESFVSNGIDNNDTPPFTTIEYDEHMSSVWKFISNAAPALISS